MDGARHLSSPNARLIERGFAVFLALHGIVHLMGTGASFTAATDGTTLEYLGGAWWVSNPATLRTLGVAWAIVAGLNVIAAWAFWVRSPRRVALLILATVPSLILSVLALWAAVVGVAIDLGLLVVAARLHMETGGEDR